MKRKYKEKKHINICPACKMPNQFLQGRAIEICQNCLCKVIRVTYYENFKSQCPLLRKPICPVHCCYVLDVVYYKLAVSPNRYIDYEFDDINAAFEVCNNCKNRDAEWVKKFTRYERTE